MGQGPSSESESIITKFPAFMQPVCSSPHSQEPSTGSYPEPGESNIHPQIILTTCSRGHQGTRGHMAADPSCKALNMFNTYFLTGI
jgi:hypothetical protein